VAREHAVGSDQFKWRMGRDVVQVGVDGMVVVIASCVLWHTGYMARYRVGSNQYRARVGDLGSDRVRMTRGEAERVRRRVAGERCPYCRRMALSVVSGRRLVVVSGCSSCGWQGEL